LAQKDKRGIALWAYRIRGAKLHRAIFHLLGDKQPQTTRQIGKNVANNPLLKNTSASTVNKSVRNLQQHGYLNKTHATERVGGPTNYYELASKAYLQLLMDAYTQEELFENNNEEDNWIIIADLIWAMQNRSN
jgi:predicted transcriptional regulator